MTCDRFDVLHKLVLLSDRPDGDGEGGIRLILGTLHRELRLAEATLTLSEPTGSFFVRSLTPDGCVPLHPLSSPVEGSPQGAALRDRSPVVRPPFYDFPIFRPDRPLGVLTVGLVNGSTLDDSALALCAAAADLLSGALGRLSDAASALGEIYPAGSFDADEVENDHRLRRLSLLYRISRAMHSTIRLNELVHLILSAASAQGGGGFDRAMLYMLNPRSGTLQGMVGVTRESAVWVLPPQLGSVWERPEFEPGALERQERSAFCQQVRRHRLLLDPRDNALARAAVEGCVVHVTDPFSEPPAGIELATRFGLTSYACAPLPGKNRALAVLVVDNSESGREITPSRLRFLELFANQAGSAVENSMLLQRLENAHLDLRETQERLVQGEKMAVLGEMAAQVAHELRNPLVSIGGFAQRLVRKTLEGSQEREYAEIVARESRRMEKLLNGILAFSRKQMLCYSPCNMEHILEEALALEHDALLAAAIDLVTDLAPALPAFHGDEQKLRQVVINLIANSRQVMGQGGTLTVRAYPCRLRGELAVALEVEDTGGGISPEVMRNIFNPFFTTKEKGTGLGLSISHRIVELHKGEIEVRNHDRGVVFVVRLPVDKPGAFG